MRVVEQWKLGRKNVDDGALLVVAKDDRTLRIEVGYGLEGVLNDAVSKRIVSEIIVPKFKEGDFYGGIAAGVDRIARLIEGEPLPPPPEQAHRGLPGQWLPYLFLLVFGLRGALSAAIGRMPGAIVTGGIATVLTWLFAGAFFIALGAGLMA